MHGDLLPDSVAARVSGFPGLDVEVISKASLRTTYSFGLMLKLTDRLQPAVYDRERAGLLRVEARGLPGKDGILELPVNLIVVF